MEAYYARRAPEYERIYDKPERQNDLALLRHWIEEAFAAHDLLEIACGTGYWTQFASRNARSILGIDYNEETLAIARARNIGPANVRFARADAFDLPSFGQTFTAGLAAFWWSHIPRRQLTHFLQGFHAALAPGAFVAFIDNRFVEGSSTPVTRTNAEGDTFQLRRLDDGSEHEILKNFPTEQELLATVAGRANGAQVRLLPYYWLLTYRVE